MTYVVTVDNIVTSPYADAKEFVVFCGDLRYRLVKYLGYKDNNWKVDIYKAKSSCFGKGFNGIECFEAPDFTKLLASYNFNNEEEENDFLDFLYGYFEEMIGDTISESSRTDS